jgi:hypothetical protein
VSDKRGKHRIATRITLNILLAGRTAITDNNRV